MVYDVENLFTVRPEKRTQFSKRKTDILSEHSPSLFNYPKKLSPSPFRNNPLDLSAAFERLGALLQNHTQNALEQNYRGKGSLLNIIA